MDAGLNLQVTTQFWMATLFSQYDLKVTQVQIPKPIVIQGCHTNHPLNLFWPGLTRKIFLQRTNSFCNYH